jgi:hypothetical protein
MTLYGVLRHLQEFLARIIGTCPTCPTCPTCNTVFPEHYFRDD